MNRAHQLWPWWRWAMTGLSALGLALSAYLGWHFLVGGSVIGCGGGSSCEPVLNSRWSAVAGVLPVSGLAAGTYLAMLIASLFIGPTTVAPDRRLAWGAMLVLVGAATGSAVWFIIVQKWIVGAFCPYCMATHIIGLLLTGLVFWKTPKKFDDDSVGDALTNPAPIGSMSEIRNSKSETNSKFEEAMFQIRPPDSFGAFGFRIWAIVGLVFAGVLAVSQVALTPAPVNPGGQVESSKAEIDPRAVPLVGSPDAPYVVTLLFDYRCSHCQKIHSMLEEAIARYDGKLAFALCPAPLNNQCNPYIARQVDEFKDSCELARIGLAVWVANRQGYADFDRWMFSPEPEGGDELWRARSLDAATAKAVDLIGQAKFDAARVDPWVDRFMQSSIRTFGQTIGPNQIGNAVPKLVFGQNWVIAQPDDANDLIQILQESLAVPRP